MPLYRTVMFATPDQATLALCSAFSSSAFAFVFLMLWISRRNDTYLLHWAASNGGYAVSLIGLEVIPGLGGDLVRMLLILLIPSTNLFALSGARAFHHRRPFRPWMIVPPVLVLGACLFGRDPRLAGLPFHLSLLAQETVIFVLIATMIVTGGPLVTRLPWRTFGGARIAGLALLAYIPTYLATIVAEHMGVARDTIGASLPLLADQLLLPIFNLGLLWMPNERAVRELREGAMRDPLTGVWNRRWLERHRAELSEPGSAVILIDIDHFKTINDSHGHAAGDAVLLGFADRARALLDRRDGFIVRLGGDEFVAIVPEADTAGARRIAEDLRLCLAGNDNAPDTTASFGVALLARGHSLSEAMAEADSALYSAKAAGRDRISLKVAPV